MFVLEYSLEKRDLSMNKPYKKMFSPLFFDLINNRLVPSEDFKEEYSLIPGFINGRENYGFTIIANKDGKSYYNHYGTEERIAAAGIEGDFLLIYEDGKTLPWRFSKDGSLVEEAVFDFRFNSDSEYYEKYRLREKSL